METSQSHVHRHVFHYEIIVSVVMSIFLLFSVYDAVFGQIGPAEKDYGTPMKLEKKIPGVMGGNDTKFKDPVTGLTQDFPVDPANPWGPSTKGKDSYISPNTYINQTNSNWGTYYNNVVDNNWGSGTGGSGTGSSTGSSSTGTGTGFGTGYDQTGWYGNGGGYYGQRGILDPGAIQTQGSYLQNRGGTYSQPGLNEAGAIKTEGVNKTTISTQTDNTLSIKNCEYITRYHKFGDRGGDVPKIQSFLKSRGYYSGKIDGVYGVGTFQAVRAFQKDYGDKVLSPWNIATEKPTGITYISTKYAINKLVGCPDPATIIPTTGKVLNY